MSFAQAYQQYRRLLRDPETRAYNRLGAAVLLREGLARSPRLLEIMEVAYQLNRPFAGREIDEALGLSMTNVSTQLKHLADAGLVSRQARPIKGGGVYYRCELTDLGRAVMEAAAEA